jgi:crossover junction endodeoxyribonuclease RuvC
MIVLGLDPGTAICGFGIVEYEEGRLKPIDVGVLLTPSDMPLPKRLLSIHTDVHTLIERYRPDTVGTEKLFFYNNVTNGIAVAGAVGVILLAIEQHGLSWAQYTPMEVKKAVSGYGHASKEQVQANVVRLLGLQETPKPDDAADALAVAICHAHSFRIGALGMTGLQSRRGRR